jgi:WD40 repeat protein
MDNTVLVSGHADGRYAVWDAPNQMLAAVIETGAGDIVDLAFSPDGAQLALAGSGNLAQLWDTANGAQLMATVGHTNYMAAATFSPDSALLAIADWDNQVWQWDTASRQELNFTTPLAELVGSSLRNDTMLVYSPDGTLLASTDGFDITLTDPATGSEVNRLEDCVGLVASIAFSPDSALLAVAASDGLCVYDVAAAALVASFVSNDWLNSVAFSPDQTMIAVAGKDHTVRVYGLP